VSVVRVRRVSFFSEVALGGACLPLPLESTPGRPHAQCHRTELCLFGSPFVSQAPRSLPRMPNTFEPSISAVA